MNTKIIQTFPTGAPATRGECNSDVRIQPGDYFRDEVREVTYTIIAVNYYHATTAIRREIIVSEPPPPE